MKKKIDVFKFITPKFLKKIQSMIDNGENTMDVMDKIEVLLPEYKTINAGTNRIVLTKGKNSDFVFKVACDNHGIDANYREYYDGDIAECLVSAYAISEDGIFLIEEKVTPFKSAKDMEKYKHDVRRMLKSLENKILLVDCKLSNFANFGLRGKQVVLLDHGDCVPFVKYQEGRFVNCEEELNVSLRCKSVGKISKHSLKQCGGKLRYSKDYDYFICDKCHSTSSINDAYKAFIGEHDTDGDMDLNFDPKKFQKEIRKSMVDYVKDTNVNSGKKEKEITKMKINGYNCEKSADKKYWVPIINEPNAIFKLSSVKLGTCKVEDYFKYLGLDYKDFEVNKDNDSSKKSTNSDHWNNDLKPVCYYITDKRHRVDEDDCDEFGYYEVTFDELYDNFGHVFNCDQRKSNDVDAMLKYINDHYNINHCYITDDSFKVNAKLKGNKKKNDTPNDELYTFEKSSKKKDKHNNPNLYDDTQNVIISPNTAVSGYINSIKCVRIGNYMVPSFIVFDVRNCIGDNLFQIDGSDDNIGSLLKKHGFKKKDFKVWDGTFDSHEFDEDDEDMIDNSDSSDDDIDENENSRKKYKLRGITEESPRYNYSADVNRIDESESITENDENSSDDSENDKNEIILKSMLFCAIMAEFPKNIPDSTNIAVTIDRDTLLNIVDDFYVGDKSVVIVDDENDAIVDLTIHGIRLLTGFEFIESIEDYDDKYLITTNLKNKFLGQNTSPVNKAVIDIMTDLYKINVSDNNTVNDIIDLLKGIPSLSDFVNDTIDDNDMYDEIEIYHSIVDLNNNALMDSSVRETIDDTLSLVSIDLLRYFIPYVIDRYINNKENLINKKCASDVLSSLQQLINDEVFESISDDRTITAILSNKLIRDNALSLVERFECLRNDSVARDKVKSCIENSISFANMLASPTHEPNDAKAAEEIVDKLIDNAIGEGTINVKYEPDENTNLEMECKCISVPESSQLIINASFIKDRVIDIVLDNIDDNTHVKIDLYKVLMHLISEGKITIGKINEIDILNN